MVTSTKFKKAIVPQMLCFCGEIRVKKVKICHSDLTTLKTHERIIIVN